MCFPSRSSTTSRWSATPRTTFPAFPKSARKPPAKWLGEYGTLDKLVENAAAITGKVGENLRNGMKELELSRKLATIDLNVKLEQPFETLKVGEPDNAIG